MLFFWGSACPSSSVVEHFHGKEGVQGSIPCLGSSVITSIHMKRLTLNVKDRKITGLCAGIADYADIDVTVVRLIVLTLDVMTGVLPGFFLYLIASAITPPRKEDNHHA